MVKKNEDLWDDSIPFSEFLVIGNDNTNYGLMKKNDAIRKAQDLGFNLLCISPSAKIPVCKMYNYDRYRFEQKKKDKEVKKTQRANIIKDKEIRLTVKIDDHDLETKANTARKFLLKGDRVKVSLKFKGRQKMYQEQGIRTITNFYNKLSDVATLDKGLDKMENNYYNNYLIPKKNKEEK